MTRRFEFKDAKSNKFWEITVKGKTVTVQYGRLGTNGQTQVKEHATPAEAEAAAEKQVAEKMKKGYQEVSGEGASAAPNAKKSVTKNAPSGKVKSARTAVDKQQLAAIWSLLGQHDSASVQQGIALLRVIDDPAIWASLAEGLSVKDQPLWSSENGRLAVPAGCAVHKRVKAAHREPVALWALRQTGRLTGLQTLNLSRCKALTDLTPLAGLTSLQTLNLSFCTALTDVTPLAGLTGLQTLDLSWCYALTDVTPLAGLTALQTLDLRGCTALRDLTPVAGLTGLKV